MAFVVEDGTGLANATSYISVAGANAYHEDRGNTDWAGLSTEKEIRTLTVTAACSSNGDLTITLNSVAFTVAVTTTEDSAAKVAAVIRAATFAGWVVSGSDAGVIFTADTAETRGGTYSIAVASTGVTGTLVQTQSGDDTSKEQALIRATFAIDMLYGPLYRGLKYSSTQALLFPREDAVDRNGFDIEGVPEELERATSIAALIELLSPGALLPEVSRGGAVKEESVSGAVKVVYQDWAPGTTQYLELSHAMYPLIISSGGNMAVLRA